MQKGGMREKVVERRRALICRGRKDQEKKTVIFLSYSGCAPFHKKILKILLQSASPVFCSCVSRPLCVCESDSALQRAIHGEKGGWEQEKRRERGSANALVQEEVKEM